ncbi:subtilisin-like protease Glyma18g48580 isoform X2 [Glycine max]|uniref:subtilisin-like protease Glyma18g48580 isoform X2 n=1 Tax=Glycine max TaxID=3847 RepID=UPI00071934D1|nr:subtilisin-like protease Glyma18g48580 isoform X2 [Glycine max]|eukprot:XP_014634953.1 subtilisin-like protease Glyma18g48580 isoform X2 [Glycine max]
MPSKGQSYIVYLGWHSHGPNPSASDLEFATNPHYKLLGSHLGSHEKAKEAIFYSYNKHSNGFAVVLEEEHAQDIAKNPNVVSVFLNKGHELQTTRSWEFLGLESDGVVPKDSIWEKARYGEGVIIANIDTVAEWSQIRQLLPWTLTLSHLKSSFCHQSQNLSL